jgi:hypothetical protein
LNILHGLKNNSLVAQFHEIKQLQDKKLENNRFGVKNLYILKLKIYNILNIKASKRAGRATFLFQEALPIYVCCLFFKFFPFSDILFLSPGLAFSGLISRECLLIFSEKFKLLIVMGSFNNLFKKLVHADSP